MQSMVEGASLAASRPLRRPRIKSGVATSPARGEESSQVSWIRSEQQRLEEEPVNAASAND